MNNLRQPAPIILLVLFASLFLFSSCESQTYYVPVTTTNNITTNISGAGNLTGNISAGYIPYATNGSALNNSALFQSGGLVGIGTRTPQAALHVNSSSASGSFLVTNTTGFTHLLINGSNGNFTLGNLTFDPTLPALSFGQNAQAKYTNSIAMGRNAEAAGVCVAIGSYTSNTINATCSGTGSMALGISTLASGLASTAVGYNAKAYGSLSYAFGGIANGSSAVAIGASVYAQGGSATAIGNGARSWNNGAMSIGNGLVIGSYGTNCIGIGGVCSGSASIGIGTSSTGDSRGQSSITLGAINNSQDYSIMFGLVNGVGTTEYFFFGAGGNVTIGANTTSTQKLRQESATATANYHQFTAGTTTNAAATDGFQVGISATGEAQLRQYENMNMTFFTNNVERLRILDTGNTVITGVLVPDASNTRAMGTSSLLFSQGHFNSIRGAGGAFLLSSDFNGAGTTSALTLVGTNSPTSGTTNLLSATLSFSPGSGNGNINFLNIAPTISQTGSANGTTTGILINPTLTTATNWTSIHVVNGNTLLGTVSGKVGINTTNPITALHVNGTIRSVNYQSADGTDGLTGTCTILGLTSVTVKNGLITGCV